MVLKINGVTMCEFDDRDPKRLIHGWLALQVHVGPLIRVQFKNIICRGCRPHYLIRGDRSNY
jgi:hypothetical protein